MALKQILFAEDAFHRLPSIIHMIQSSALPESELPDIFSHVSTLIYGTLSQKKLGLAILKCCLVFLYKHNKINDNIDYLLKWWKGVVNCIKSRYTADTTYRLACVNATILTQTCGSYVDLLMEGRANVPVLVAACTSHVCSESFDLLLALTRMFPSHIGKHYEAIRSFCLSHVSSVHSEKCADILARLTCVGSSGKLSVNYTQSWKKAVNSCMRNVNNLLCTVLGQEVGNTDTTRVLLPWEFTGTIEDVERANLEMTFLFRYISSLLKMKIDVSTLYPLKSLRGMIQCVTTAYCESLTYTGTTENFSRKLVVNHTVKEVLSMLKSTVDVLKTTVYLIQEDIENLLYNLLQRRSHVGSVLELLHAMLETGCTLSSLPYILLVDLLSLTSLHIKGPVTKKQKTEQFNTFTFETSTLGSHCEEDIVLVLKILCLVVKRVGTRPPQLKLETVKEKCEEILANKESFSDNVLKNTHQLLNVMSSQSFDFSSVLTRSSSAHHPPLHTFFCNEISFVEPNLHPERHSFRNKPTESNCSIPNGAGNEINSETNTDNIWEGDVLFSNLPHSSQINGTDVDMEEDGDREEEEEDGEEEEEENISSRPDDSIQSEEDSSCTTFTVIPPSNTLHTPAPVKINSETSTDITKSRDINLGDKENRKPNEVQQSGALSDILSAFVDEPPSGDEM